MIFMLYLAVAKEGKQQKGRKVGIVGITDYS
jgi:hypothetical protein